MMGYRGKILRVDLGLGKSYPSVGLGCRILYDFIDATTKPLGPENPLLFITGPFSGTMVPTGSRATVCARSPHTGLWGYSTFGGHLGADLKFAGYDGILLVGSSDTPVYLLVNDDKVEIRDASHLWGKDTQVVWETLKDETGFKIAGIARIGVGGENLVKYANIIVDYNRAAGRTGLGAVMGSKKLKAIVVHGTDRKVPVAKPEALEKYAAALNADKREDPTYRMYTDLGSAGYADMASIMYGSMPAGYYTVPDFDSYNLSGTSVRETILVGKKSCYRCPIACGRVIEVKDGKYATGRFAGPEYQTTASMGTLLLNDSLKALAYANKQLALLGLDSISAGNTIAFAYYLFNEEIITAKDLDGIKPKWGEMDSALNLLEKIAAREGVGDLMAEGIFAFGKKFGVENLAAQCNGMEIPMHDPRGFSGLAIAYTTSPRGACHMTADMYTVQMGQENPAIGIESVDRFANEAVLVARQQDFRSVTNSALLCNFYPFQAEEVVDLYKLVTGVDFDLDDLVKTGERIFTFMRLMNLRLGYDSKKEKLPDIVLRPLEGPTEGYVPNTDEHLDTWYEYRGWDRKTGRPPTSKLKELGLQDIL
ncbi:MAG: aldehyde ferredoxin oxidoreductase family protein [Candidatus Thorarchaeota archaeon]|jgi:aldehyde:ferredoxin oxidoreductase